MNEWLAQLDINSVIIGLFAGLIIGFIAVIAAAKVSPIGGGEGEQYAHGQRQFACCSFDIHRFVSKMAVPFSSHTRSLNPQLSAQDCDCSF